MATTQLVETTTAPCLDVRRDQEGKIEEIMEAAKKMDATRLGMEGPEYHVRLAGLPPGWFSKEQLEFATKARNITFLGRGQCGCGCC